MAGTEIALYNDPFEGDYLEKAAALAPKLARTSFVPEAFRNKPEELLATFLVGHEIGVGPMTALQKINVIKGKPTLSSELMRALVQSRGHEIWTEDLTNTRVVLCGQRNGSEHVSKVTWTMDDAKRARLEGKDNWRQYPRAMLLARATGELCRLMFADVLGGISYTPEEIDDGLWIDAPSGTALAAVSDDETVGDTPKAITRKAAAPRKAAGVRKAAEPAQKAAGAPLPPLPGEDDTAPSEAEEASKKRATMIAMKCSEAGLDDDGRHNLISAVTNGVKNSAKTVTAEEGADVLLALVEINGGQKALLEGDGGWVLVEVEDVAGEPFEAEAADEADLLAPGSWDGDAWRSYTAARGVTTTQVLREAHRLCGESPGVFGKAPGKIGELQGRDDLCALLVGFVEDHADPSGGE